MWRKRQIELPKQKAPRDRPKATVLPLRKGGWDSSSSPQQPVAGWQGKEYKG